MEFGMVMAVLMAIGSIGAFFAGPHIDAFLTTVAVGWWKASQARRIARQNMAYDRRKRDSGFIFFQPDSVIERQVRHEDDRPVRLCRHVATAPNASAYCAQCRIRYNGHALQHMDAIPDQLVKTLGVRTLATLNNPPSRGPADRVATWGPGTNGNPTITDKVDPRKRQVNVVEEVDTAARLYTKYDVEEELEAKKRFAELDQMIGAQIRTESLRDKY